MFVRVYTCVRVCVGVSLAYECVAVRVVECVAECVAVRVVECVAECVAASYITCTALHLFLLAFFCSAVPCV